MLSNTKAYQSETASQRSPYKTRLRVVHGSFVRLQKDHFWF